jgi:hypothetical protein
LWPPNDCATAYAPFVDMEVEFPMYVDMLVELPMYVDMEIDMPVAAPRRTAARSRRFHPWAGARVR